METTIFPAPVVDPLRLNIAESLLTQSVMLNKLCPLLDHRPSSARYLDSTSLAIYRGSDKFLEHLKVPNQQWLSREVPRSSSENLGQEAE